VIREKGEEEVRGRARERCRAYIDGADAPRRQEKRVKAASGSAIPEEVDTIPRRAVGCPSVAGGGGWQSGSSMGAVSGAPLTVTTYTKVTISYPTIIVAEQEHLYQHIIKIDNFKSKLILHEPTNTLVGGPRPRYT
jgi:hypothetical protein